MGQDGQGFTTIAEPVVPSESIQPAVSPAILNEVARRLLAGEFRPGDVVRVDFADGEFTFAKKSAEAPRERPVRSGGGT